MIFKEEDTNQKASDKPSLHVIYIHQVVLSCVRQTVSLVTTFLSLSLSLYLSHTQSLSHLRMPLSHFLFPSQTLELRFPLIGSPSAFRVGHKLLVNHVFWCPKHPVS